MTMNIEQQSKEKSNSSSLMVTNATERDIRTLNIFEREEGLEGELMHFIYRLIGDKFVMVIHSLNATDEWSRTVLPKLATAFGADRCRYETKVLETEIEPEPAIVPNTRTSRRGRG